jgi:hypothetical protein
MKQIHITRSNGIVTFETVSIDTTETVFFTNMDTTEPHWPTISTNQLGPYQSPNSSQCTIPLPTLQSPPLPPLPPPVPFVYSYGCKIPGHENEAGVVNVYNPLAAASPTNLGNFTKGTPIAPPVPVVTGGKSPYSISGQVFQVTNANGNIIQQGSNSIGPGLQLAASNNSTGIAVTGTPTVSGTYSFTFTVNDATGANLQGVQYSMVVA